MLQQVAAKSKIKRKDKRRQSMSVEMKDSGIDWIGNIPKHWDVCRIKNILVNGKDGIKIGPFGSSLTNKVDGDGEYKIYGQWNIVNKDFCAGKNYISEETFNDLSVYRIVAGDILVSMMGTIGKCAIIPNNIQQGIMDSHVIKIRLSELFIPAFFEYLYDKDNSGLISEQLNRVKKGSIMDGLNSTIVKNLTILLPPKEEQSHIANFLDKKCAEIDELIALQEQMIAQLTTYKQAVITETVTKGLNPNVKMKDSGVEWIGEIPEHWETPKMKYYITLYSGDAISVNEFVDNGLYPVYGGGEKIANCNKFNTQSTDILIGRVGARCGCVTLPLQKCWATDNALILQSTLCLNYLYYMLIGANLNNLNTSNAQPLITGGKIKNLNIPLPIASEQQSIANYLDQKCKEIDELISIKKEKIEHLKAYKKSVIYEYVTGKKQVTI